MHLKKKKVVPNVWGSGYDFYSPGDNVLWHHYYRAGKPRMESTPGYWQHQQVAVARVRYLLKLAATRENAFADTEAEKYGMGKVRTVSDYWKFAGIEPTKRDHSEGNSFWCRHYSGHPPYDEDWRLRLPPNDPSREPAPEKLRYRPLV
eukprot:Hpha_TRINITY_DN15532_c2_g1::TRINITY_DN15532_c2_g1_i1::g.109050::m.109050